MTTTKTQWAVCYCRDGFHAETDHESWQDSPNEPHRTLTFYEPLAHMLTQELTSTVTVAEYGPATSQALALAGGAR